MNRTIHLSAPACRALQGAFVSFSQLYRAMAVRETDLKASVSFGELADAAEVLSLRLMSPGAYALEKPEAGMVDRAIRMGSAALQTVIGDRALPKEIRDAARFDMSFLDEIHRELRPDLQHAPRTAP